MVVFLSVIFLFILPEVFAAEDAPQPELVITREVSHYRVDQFDPGKNPLILEPCTNFRIVYKEKEGEREDPSHLVFCKTDLRELITFAVYYPAQSPTSLKQSLLDVAINFQQRYQGVRIKFDAIVKDTIQNCLYTFDNDIFAFSFAPDDANRRQVFLKEVCQQFNFSGAVRHEIEKLCAIQNV